MYLTFVKISDFFPGHCTEFNDKGGIIQMQRRSPCNNSGFPKCEIFYKSSDAYKC